MMEFQGDEQVSKALNTNCLKISAAMWECASHNRDPGMTSALSVKFCTDVANAEGLTVIDTARRGAKGAVFSI